MRHPFDWGCRCPWCKKAFREVFNFWAIFSIAVMGYVIALVEFADRWLSWLTK